MNNDRAITLLGKGCPLYVIGPDDAPEQIGRLHSLVGSKYWLDRGTWPTLCDEAFNPDKSQMGCRAVIYPG